MMKFILIYFFLTYLCLPNDLRQVHLNDFTKNQLINVYSLCDLSKENILKSLDSNKNTECDSFMIINKYNDSLLINKIELISLFQNIELANKEYESAEVMVSSERSNLILSSLNSKVLKITNQNYSNTSDISKILTNINGVAMISTSPGSTKPVIRGLYGNRILTLFNGLKFDNQQWQDEHGMNLNKLGVDYVNIIKGPASIIYGSEALGGIIDIVDIGKNKIPKSEKSVCMNLHSNTGGAELEYNSSNLYKNSWFNIFTSLISHSDYNDGNGNRVLNSRFSNFNFKTNYGFIKNNWKSVYLFNSNYSLNGFIFNDYESFTSIDNRWSKLMNGPHHIVNLNNFSNLNSIHFDKSSLDINYSLKTNYRAENEGGNELSLKMLQLSSQIHLIYNYKLDDIYSFLISSNSNLLKNTNYGKRKIIPNAMAFESNIAGVLKANFNFIVAELGISQGYSQINSLYTNGVNSEEKDLDPFFQRRYFNNIMFGFNYFKDNFNCNYNISSGIRVPNLVELSSNGLHEGVYVYEIGDPNLENEKSINNNLDLNFNFDNFSLNGSLFFNKIKNFIYLKSKDGDWFGFPIQEFIQKTANLYGGELQLECKNILKNTNIVLAYSNISGVFKGNSYLPFIPANSLKFEVKFTKIFNDNFLIKTYLKDKYVFEQTKFSSYESYTSSYNLINIGIDFNWDNKYQIQLNSTNLLDVQYFDNLSRLKYFGYYNQGRVVTLTFLYNY